MRIDVGEISLEKGENVMGLRGFIIKRTLFSIFLVFFVLTLNFIIFQLMPGNPLEMFAGANKIKTPEMRDEIIKRFGLDKSVGERFVLYIENMLTFNFGVSYRTGDYIIKDVGNRMFNTLLLMGTSEILAIAIGIALGVIAAHRRGGIYDNGSVIASLTTYSLPSFWIGMMLLLIFYFNLGWFPNAGTYPANWAIVYQTTGGLPPKIILGNLAGIQIALPSLLEIQGRLTHLFLPVLTLTLFSYGGYLLLTRATMLETLSEDYIVTARAKGLKERTVLFKHALKNASLPLITNAALTFGFILSGAIITEQVFSYAGLGHWTWLSINYYDYPALQTIFFLIALCVIVANFIADVLYGVVDPRIKYG